MSLRNTAILSAILSATHAAKPCNFVLICFLRNAAIFLRLFFGALRLYFFWGAILPQLSNCSRPCFFKAVEVAQSSYLKDMPCSDSPESLQWDKKVLESSLRVYHPHRNNYKLDGFEKALVQNPWLGLEKWFRGEFSVKWSGFRSKSQSYRPKVGVTDQKSELQPGRPPECELNRSQKAPELG